MQHNAHHSARPAGGNGIPYRVSGPLKGALQKQPVKEHASLEGTGLRVVRGATNGSPSRSRTPTEVQELFIQTLQTCKVLRSTAEKLPLHIDLAIKP